MNYFWYSPLFGMHWNLPISPDLIQVNHLAPITITQKARFSGDDT